MDLGELRKDVISTKIWYDMLKGLNNISSKLDTDLEEFVWNSLDAPLNLIPRLIDSLDQTQPKWIQIN